MASASAGPTVHRRQLGAELRRLRLAAQLKNEQVAKALGCSMTRVSRIETGRGSAVPKPDEVRKLCELYGVSDERHVQKLLGLLSGSQKRGWWEPYEDVLPIGLDVYVGLENDARIERAWEPLVVHGLLQTPEYARAVIEAAGLHRPPDIDGMVEVRLRRQNCLSREKDPLELWLVLDELVIRRPIGGVQVMRDQLHHLLTMAELPNVTVQVLPCAKGSHPGLDGSFTLMEFDEEPSVIYVESPAGNLYLERRPDIRRFISRLDMLRAMALAPDDTMALLKNAAEEMR